MGGWGRTLIVGAVSMSLASSLVLAAAGCGGKPSKSEPQASTVSATSATSSEQPHEGDVNGNGVPDSSASDKDWPGKMTTEYQDATSPEAITGRDLMKSNQLLEGVADSINQTLKLPYDISLIGKQCGEANAYWNHDDKTMTICYEDAADALDIYTKDGDKNPAESAINSEMATAFHETGHMVIDLYDLPTTGREEDVADQLAAFILLAPGSDGKRDPDLVQAVKDFAREFQGYSTQKGGEIDDGQLADVHSLDKTRMYNLECWVYGSDPAANADLVTDGLLPQDRADGCPEEYQKLSSSWEALLGPYIK